MCDKKNHVEFHGSLFLALEFPRGVAKFCRLSRREALFSPEFAPYNLSKYMSVYGTKYI